MVRNNLLHNRLACVEIVSCFSCTRASWLLLRCFYRRRNTLKAWWMWQDLHLRCFPLRWRFYRPLRSLLREHIHWGGLCSLPSSYRWYALHLSEPPDKVKSGNAFRSAKNQIREHAKTDIALRHFIIREVTVLYRHLNGRTARSCTETNSFGDYRARLLTLLVLNKT